MRVCGGTERQMSSRIPGDPDGLEDDGRRTAGRAIPTVHRGLDGRVHYRGRAHGRGERPPAGREIAGNDLLDALRPQHRDQRQTDRARAQDERTFAATDPGLVDRVHRNRNRLRERCRARVQPVRNRQAHPRRELHPLRERTDVVVREPDEFEAVRCEGHRHADDEVANLDRHTVGVGSEFEHLAAVLVTHHVVGVRIEGIVETAHTREREHGVGVVQRVQVRTADATCLHRDERLARREHRLPNVVHHHLALSGDRCTHGRSMRGIRLLGQV